VKLFQIRSKVGWGFVACLLLSLLAPATSEAVTFGSIVTDPGTQAPWVVSIWNSENNDVKDAEFRCTGTLIGPHTVLTAAHCILESGSYFVKVKSQALNDNTPFSTVSGVLASPRYNAKTNVADIGFLKLNEDFKGIKFPSLVNSEFARSINKFTKFNLYGWGRDQAGQSAELLKSTVLQLQDAQATKDYKTAFNPKTMISAGRKIVAEKVWSGACNGDSGGPLTATINGIVVIAGVTSWGEKSCLSAKPTIFSRVSYHLTDIQKGIKDVELASTAVNRTPPTPIVEPALTGDVIPGNTLTCNPGQWKNAISTSTSWLSPARLISTKTNTAVVKTADGGQEFSCEVIASSQNSVVRKVLRVKANVGPVVKQQPAISGIDSYGPVRVGTTITCDSWAWDAPVDSEIIKWYSAGNNSAVAPINGTLLGTGRDLLITSSMIKTGENRYIVCDVTGTRAGFSADAITSVAVTPAELPVITSVSIPNTGSIQRGMTYSCVYKSSGTIDASRVDWGFSEDGIHLTQFPGLSAQSITITPEVMRMGAGRQLACQVTLYNSGGEVKKLGLSFASFPGAPTQITPTISLYGPLDSNTLIVCNTPSSVYWWGTPSYSWGVVAAPNSTSFIGAEISKASNFALSKEILNQAAGKYIACVLTLTNEAGFSTNVATLAIPENIAALPVFTSPIVDREVIDSSSITEYITVPAIYGWNPVTMKIVLKLAGSDCDGRQITSIPTTVACSNLKANTQYSVYIVGSYLNPNNPGMNQSPAKLFTTGAPKVLLPGLSPIFGTPTSTQFGFTVQITNYDSRYTWVPSFYAPGSPSISATVSNSGLVTVSNMRDNVSGTLIIQSERFGYEPMQNRVEGWSLPTGTYICGQSCTGSLSSEALQAMIADTRQIAAISITGGPITHSTCSGVGCNPGAALPLPVPCGATGIEKTSVITNSTMPITTSFRYCLLANPDTTAPTIANDSRTYTGYAPIIPTSGLAGTSIAVRFIARDNIGIATTSARLVNPQGVVVNTAAGQFQVGGGSDGGYIAYLATASSGPLGGDIYQIQAQAVDGAGNFSAWTSIGTFTVTVPAGPSVSNLGTLTTPTTIGISYTDKIILNGFILGNIPGYSSGYTWSVRVSTDAGVVKTVTPESSNQVYISDLTPGTQYSIVLVATDSAGQSKSSAALTASTLATA